MRFKHLLVTLTALGALVLLAAVPAAQAATGVAYDVSGSYVGGFSGEGTFAYSYDGTASCGSNCTGAPTGGTFTLGLTGPALHPPSPCVSRRVSGTLTVTWADATTTTVALAGKNQDRKGFSLSGNVTASTNPFFPPSPGTSVKGFVSFPPNPCNPGSFTGAFTFYPPSPG
jgi:hypothetical protein